jgi:hypothetical protein
MAEPVQAEGTFTVNFTYTFTVKPTFTYGSELAGNQSPVRGAFPQFSATVSSWITRPAGHTLLYEGAVVSYVVSGVAGSQMICHYSFQGTAMSPLDMATNDTGSV